MKNPKLLEAITAICAVKRQIWSLDLEIKKLVDDPGDDTDVDRVQAAIDTMLVNLLLDNS